MIINRPKNPQPTSGVNRKRRKRKGDEPTKKLSELVSDYLGEEIMVRENGVPKRMTNYEAITTQLLIKAFGGNAKARKVLMRYAEYARKRDPGGGIAIMLKE